MLSRLLDPRGLAAGRTALGVCMLARPAALAALMGVDRQTSDRVGWVVQMLGAREVALGVGALTSRQEPRRWLAAGLLSDAVDAVAVAAAVGRGQVRVPSGAALVAVAAVAAGVQVQELRRG